MKRIAVIAGGYSGEHPISMKSASTIMGHLDRQYYDPTLIELTRDGCWAHTGDERVPIDLNDFSYSAPDGKVSFDMAYIIVHGTPGEDGLLQGYLDMIGLPYSTGDALNMALTFNKVTTQTILRSNGMNVAEFIVVDAHSQDNTERMISKVGLPCFVKPAQAGSSLGVSKVKTEGELGDAVTTALELADQVIIESELKGREITCGAYREGDEVIALPITELIYETEFFDYHAKYADERTSEVTPADLSDDVRSRCQELTREIYRLLNCRGIIRVDYFLCDEDLFVIEINSVPGMSQESIVPKMIRATGRSVTEVLSTCLEQIKTKEGSNT